MFQDLQIIAKQWLPLLKTGGKVQAKERERKLDTCFMQIIALPTWVLRASLSETAKIPRQTKNEQYI